MRGTLRWARADLRARRGQALTTIAVVAGVVAALFLAIMLLQGAVNPWQQLFGRTRGADVLVYFQDGTNTADLRQVAGIHQMGTPYQAASATLEQGAVKSPVELRAMTPAPPAMSVPIIVDGSWLRSSAPDGAVLEASFAQAVHVGVGDRIQVDGIDGTTVAMAVIGIADTADQGFYPQWTPGLIWVQHKLLTRVEPNPSETHVIVGLRLDDNSAIATGQVVQTIWNLYNGVGENSAVERYSTWQQVRDSMASNDRLLGLLLALFGIIALVAAPCAIANVTAGRVLVQRQDIAMLKALGFTPGQVVRMLLAEQTLLGAAGAALGLAAALIITSPEFVRPPGGTPVGLAPLSGSWMALIGAGTVLTVAVATVIPSWWAGRVSPVAAVQPSPPRGHLSLIARLSLLFHLPAALVLGARDSLTRRLSAVLTVFGLAIPMVMITIALTCWSTIDGFTSNPGKIGLASAVTVSQGGLDSKQMLALIGRDSQVLAAYPGAQFVTLLPGDNGTFIARAMGTSSRPYPFQVVRGRMFHAANEAVAGQGFLDLMHIAVGAWIKPTIDGVPVILHIVGRTIEPDNNRDVVDFGLDALYHSGSASP
ncbi:MAG TPA: FtsX-like permease family protein, partial [Streptosporangiaceae bacterium]|nr:FtsX-like permease family protein [Streptosporangiaceae bacterium]